MFEQYWKELNSLVSLFLCWAQSQASFPLEVAKKAPIALDFKLTIVIPVEKGGFSNSFIQGPNTYFHSLIFKPVTVNQRTECCD